jgi:hypothetical protein
MGKLNSFFDRRNFIKRTASFGAGVAGLAMFSQPTFAADRMYTGDDEINIIGPREGFAPQIGTLLSMMEWMRAMILRPVNNLSVQQLDYLHDSKSNSIGSMLLHLAATERYYQLHTLGNMKWGTWSDDIKKQWDVPMRLGDDAREKIKGHDLNYYLDILKEVRENTIQEFKKRDDKWLMAVDKEWFWGPTNNYCKWFHVCEHESNHNGQIKWIKSRL